jgi:hypothetical protein
VTAKECSESTNTQISARVEIGKGHRAQGDDAGSKQDCYADDGQQIHRILLFFFLYRKQKVHKRKLPGISTRQFREWDHLLLNQKNAAVTILEQNR